MLQVDPLSVADSIPHCNLNYLYPVLSRYLPPAQSVTIRNRSTQQRKGGLTLRLVWVASIRAACKHDPRKDQEDLDKDSEEIEKTCQEEEQDSIYHG